MGLLFKGLEIGQQCAGDGKVQLGPNILKSHVIELFSSRQGSMAEQGC